MRFLAPKWLGAMQVWVGAAALGTGPVSTRSLSFGRICSCGHHSAACSRLGVCQDRVSGQLIKTQLMTARRSASRTLGILVHGSLSFQGCLPAQPRWDKVSLWLAGTVPAPAQKAI